MPTTTRGSLPVCSQDAPLGFTRSGSCLARDAGLAGSAGVFLFYVQHQYEDVYWERHDEWSFAAAALQGSSYLRLPRVLQYFTGNIGLHHVHHMSSQIPNYNLQRAHDEVPAFHSAPVFSIREAVKLTRLKLWDEDAARMVTFEQTRVPRSTA